MIIANCSRNILALVTALFFSACVQHDVYSQALSVSPSQLNFGTAYENAADSLQITLTNQLGRMVTVTGIRFYDTYGSSAFSNHSGVFDIQPFSSQTIWIKFSPVHNIFHNSEMVIENDGLRGYTSADLLGQGKYSNSYYDSTQNQSEEDLKTAIHDITGIGYVSLGYNLARDEMFMTIDNQMVNGQGASQNTLEGVYTGIIAAGYIDRTDCQTQYGFNTEHTYPQSLFASAEPMRSDLHHLFPTDDAANTARADNPFGIVSSPGWTGGGSKSDGSTFEPRDQHKGACARAMIYFVLRYQNYNNFFTPQESILRTWHKNFLPSQVERIRNADIQVTQHNRNPFVDYPQFLDRITSVSNFSIAPVLPAIDLTEDTIVYGFIPQSTATTFHYVIINKGNTNVHFTNFNLSNPGILAFANGGADTVIAPGESLGININCIPASTDSLHGWLSFNTDIPGMTQVTIPIYANDSVVSGIPAIDDEPFSVYPNPAYDFVNLSFVKNIPGQQNIFVMDNLGRKYFLPAQPGGEKKLRLDIHSLSPGVYLLGIEMPGRGFYFYRKILKF